MVQEKGGSLIDTLSAQVIYLTDDGHSSPALLAPFSFETSRGL